MTDLCWECQKNNNLINRTVNCEEEKKTATLQRQEAHLQHVKEERTLYKKQVADARVVVADGSLKLGRNDPCSRECVMHYSFDFAQQIHYPSNPLQPGPMYFVDLRKCGIFGVCCEGVPQQVNYLIDEGMTSTKGSNAVISYLHHFFENYGLGEEHLSLHCDNCSGQNKNRYMLFYLMWRTLHGLHKDISLNFMVAGHTKFSPDWCFGLLKQKYRRTQVSTLEDIARVTVESTATRLNMAQLVGSESQEVFVPSYDWQTFLGAYFKPIDGDVGIKSFQHFRFSCEEPGVVYASKRQSDEEKKFNLLRSPNTLPPVELPEELTPPGLDAERQWYLFDEVREFCSEKGADITCPRPTVPNPKKLVAEESDVVLEQKVKRRK
ncbi:uncharacterized protein LOC117292140 isoform X2 [Asterias rubens]|nr:uncharacterized protein LOC117292140 isoform X2 [Asterias rubens]